MSKAFVKDDTSEPDTAEAPEAPALPPGGKNYITPAGFARLQSEKKRLLEVERPVRIVGVDEVDPANGCVSWVSPIARALIKARAGDVVRLHTPAGEEKLEILEVDYP